MLILHGNFLFFVSIFLIHPSEELVKFFFLLNLPILIGFLSEGSIVLCNCFYCAYGQTDNGSHIGASLLGFVLPLLFFRIVGILVFCQPPKSRYKPDTSPDSTAEDATVMSMNRRFSFFCLPYSS